MSIGIGVIGCGARIRGVLEQIPGIGKAFRVEALCDPDPRSIRAARERFNASATVHADARALARDPKVDWVFIGSWNCWHRAHAEAAFAAGKHIFCEKPLATTLEDCLALRRAQKKAGTMFAVGFTLRYSPHYRKIRELVAAGTIGRILSFEFNETLHWDHGGYIHGDWRRLTANAGTHLLEKCCHDVDLVNWIVGRPALRAASFGGRDFFVPANAKMQRRLGRSASGAPSFQTWGGLINKNPFTADKDILDNQVAIVEYAGGARCTFHTNCATAIPERRMLLCGTEGTLRADVISGTIETRRFGYKEELRRHDTGASGGHGGGDQRLGRELRDAMQKHIAPPTTLEDGLRAALTCFGIDEAQEKGKVVDLRPLWKKAGLPAK